MQVRTPLIVDLDGTLLRGDSLHELVAAALRHPKVLIGAVVALLTGGRAAFKRQLASRIDLDASLLPVNEDVVAFIRDEHASGRPVHLATGADERVAKLFEGRFAELGQSFASDGHTNLTSRDKADRLVTVFGEKGFDYVGNSRQDLAVWDRAANAFLVSTPPQRRQPSWAKGVQFARVFGGDRPARWHLWLSQLRIHQSIKNILLFLPLVAAHGFGNTQAIALLLAGFVSFTLMASSVYLLNDVLDLSSDRRHPRKASRAVASGNILPLHALGVSLPLAVLSIVIALAVGLAFTGVLLAYAASTVLYSFWLKRVTLVDVTMLALLYMSRILAGAVIAEIELSFWFTGVTLFLFLSLALVKRYAELALHATAEGRAPVPGRGYSHADSTVVLALGIGAGVAVLLLMAIYLQSDAVTLLYPSGGFLWLVIPALFYWIGNIWIKAGRGQMHDDPIVFALKDTASLISAALIGLLFVAASTPAALLLQLWFSTWGLR